MADTPEAQARIQPPAGDPLIGRVVEGRYRIRRRIARGGMASVYEATDARLDRVVAVKVMHAGLGDDDSFAERFVREARSAARIDHPNVVSVFDQGDDGDDVLYLVMEYVPGQTLRDVIRREAPLPPARALALFEPIVAALGAAHAAGLIHRDIKPENVLIADDGRVKVADFGLARAASADTQHTATGGVLIGTVSYLAPELVVDGRSDARADVYALGVVLYELLTGTKPHEGESPIAVAYKHVHEDVPAPSLVATGLPGYVDALVGRLTSRDRALRPSDAGVVLRQTRRVALALADGSAEDPDLEADLRLPPLHVVPPMRPGDTREEEGLPLGTPARDDGPEHTAAFLTSVSAPPTRQAGTDATGGDRPEPTAITPRGRAADDAQDSAVSYAEPAALSAPSALSGPAGVDHHGDQGPGAPSGQRRGGPAGPGGGDGTPPGRPARRRGRWQGPLAVLLAVLLAAGIGVGVWWFGYERYTHAPGVVGLDEVAAAKKLEDAGLDVGFADPKFVFSENDKFPAGTVLKTDPEAGERVLDGSTVEITLSAGKERHDVPELAGLTEDQAQDAIAEAGLVFGESSPAYDDDVPEGRVVSSDPEPGTSIHPRVKVDLVLSRGPRPVQIKDWAGKDADRVADRLTKRGLEVDYADEEFSDSVPEGAIISNSPASGQLFRGDTITFTVSKGPDLVEVPDVYLSGTEAARQTLEDAGFEVEVEEAPNSYGLGFVTDQDPDGGSEAPRGSTVTIYII